MKKIMLMLMKLVYIIVLVSTVISLIREFNNDIKNVILCLVSILLYFVPLVSRRIRKVVPNALRIVLVLFVFSTIVLGEVNNFYELIPIWDDIIHIVQGFFVAWIGFLLGLLIFNKCVYNGDNIDKDKNVDRISTKYVKIFIILFSLLLSFGVGTVWEIVEYTVDCNVNVDMQKDNYVYKFSSVLLNSAKDNEVMIIDDIGYTTIYDKMGDKIITFNGYLDIGNKDTMSDLIDTLVGSIIFCVIGSLYFNNKYKDDF